jgi:hypothetical protein
MGSTYFSNFPFVRYTLNPSPQPNEAEWVTDIFRRSAPLAQVLSSARLFYPYQVKDGETAEIVAHKYYGSMNYYWVVTLLNGIVDPLLDWPKTYANFTRYVVDKYGSIASAMSTTHHYSMTHTKQDSLGNKSTQTFIIDADKYATLTSLVPEVYTFANGVTVTKTTTRSVVDCYTYEQELNESKRNIRLLKIDYLPQVVRELEGLLAI